MTDPVRFTIDLCAASNSVRRIGSSLDVFNFQGNSYIIKISPEPFARVVIAETLPTSDGEEYDTILYAMDTCKTSVRNSSDWVSLFLSISLFCTSDKFLASATFNILR